MLYKVTNPDKVEHLFAGWEETMIWSCLQNVMGCLYTNHRENPMSVIAVLGDFAFFAGEVCEELISDFMTNNYEKDFMILVPQNEMWGGMIEKCYGNKCRKVIRYAFKKEADIFDTKKLEKMVCGLQDEYRLVMIDERWFSYCKKIDWCKDFVAQYETFDIYDKNGLGVLVTKDDVPVSGASSYSGYLNGIEIEIDTREDYRRKGLATICGARLILECIKKKIYPSWDAQNLWSVALAEKLGYHFSHKYTAYEVYEK
ncbi:MAG: GNAT family N-acetyltransferase [Eubacteriales bacterium]|nr:GNAT family N-acetyltransferase [Eubacteriales bacterium]